MGIIQNLQAQGVDTNDPIATMQALTAMQATMAQTLTAIQAALAQAMATPDSAATGNTNEEENTNENTEEAAEPATGTKSAAVPEDPADEPEGGECLTIDNFEAWLDATQEAREEARIHSRLQTMRTEANNNENTTKYSGSLHPNFFCGQTGSQAPRPPCAPPGRLSCR